MVLPYQDLLTGLPNKAFFEARVAEAIRWARRCGSGLVVLYVDLDRFKELDRILGRAVCNREPDRSDIPRGLIRKRQCFTSFSRFLSN